MIDPEHFFDTFVGMQYNLDGLDPAAFTLLEGIAAAGNIVIGTSDLFDVATNENVAPTLNAVLQLNGHDPDDNENPLVEECDPLSEPVFVMTEVINETDVRISAFGIWDCMITGNVSIGDELTISHIAGVGTRAGAAVPANMKYGIALESHSGAGIDVQKVFLNKYS